MKMQKNLRYTDINKRKSKHKTRVQLEHGLSNLLDPVTF